MPREHARAIDFHTCRGMQELFAVTFSSGHNNESSRLSAGSHDVSDGVISIWEESAPLLTPLLIKGYHNRAKRWRWRG
jgi:hypothetical protein